MDTPESFNLLQLIANDSYRVREFRATHLRASVAHDFRPSADGTVPVCCDRRSMCGASTLDPECRRTARAWEEQVVADDGAEGDLREVQAMVRNTSNPQVEADQVRIITRGARRTT